jgi:hypothetical protein
MRHVRPQPIEIGVADIHGPVIDASPDSVLGAWERPGAAHNERPNNKVTAFGLSVVYIVENYRNRSAGERRNIGVTSAIRFLMRISIILHELAIIPTQWTWRTCPLRSCTHRWMSGGAKARAG